MSAVEGEVAEVYEAVAHLEAELDLRQRTQ
jgi:hypothetical protein